MLLLEKEIDWQDFGWARTESKGMMGCLRINVSPTRAIL